jgi:hypothetical protein
VLQTQWAEADVPKTAVALFENSVLADQVLHDLLASGFHGNDVRILGGPREMAVGGVRSIPHTDFEAGLNRDLTAFGVAQADAEVYVRAVRYGRLMVFVTGSDEDAGAAAEIMNRHHAVEVGELICSELNLPRTDVDGMAPGPDRSFQAATYHSRSRGARLYVW